MAKSIKMVLKRLHFMYIIISYHGHFFSIQVYSTSAPMTDFSEAVDETPGIPLYTFTSETASLIKFLTVARIPACHNSHGSKPDPDMVHCAPAGHMQSSGPLCSDRDDISGPSGGSGDLATGCNMPMYASYKQQYGQCVTGSMEEDETCAFSTVKRDTCDIETKSHDSSLNFQNTCRLVDSDNFSSMDDDYGNIAKPSKATHVCKCSVCDKFRHEALKNLIYVTGEFAVALHQIGFKNITRPTRPCLGRWEGRSESEARARLYEVARNMGVDMDNGEGDGEMIWEGVEPWGGHNMVVNYSNRDVHMLEHPREADKPDNLIDLSGHVTGLCLTADQRYSSTT